MKGLAGGLPLVLLWALPLAAGLVMALAGADLASWQALLAHPQAFTALLLSLATGLASTTVSLLVALAIAAGLYGTRAWERLQSFAGVTLAVPHLAFAIGFGLLIMPSGLLARLLVGGQTPPPWMTVQDPLGISLVAALVLKEVPFLLVMIWAVLARGDSAVALSGQWRAARSLGHGPGSVWLRIVQPQLLQRLAWPLAAVLAYGCTVVDMALVLGPTQPPTLAVLVWRDLNDAAAEVNGRGLAGAMLLTLGVAGLFVIAVAILRLMRSGMSAWRISGPSRLAAPRRIAALASAALAFAYVAVLALLALISIAPRWTYPRLLPDVFDLSVWSRALSDPAPLVLSLLLGLATTAVALVLAVLWFETQPRRRDPWPTSLALASLVLPQILIVAGQYRAGLALGLTGTLAGLFLVHLTPVLAYVMVVLAGPYRALDPRYARTAASLGASPARILFRVKLPLLLRPILIACAVAFAVSVGQYLATLFAGNGRVPTLTTEAVTLAAGADRRVIGAYALMQAALPLLFYLLAAALPAMLYANRCGVQGWR
jgi:putative thiamine transport system permease protein